MAWKEKLAEIYVEITAPLGKLKSGMAQAHRIVKYGAQKIWRAVKYATAAIVGIGVAATKMAANVVESENLYEISMGRMAKATRKWSDELAKALHLNAFEVRRFTGIFNVMLTSMGFGIGKAAEMSKRLTMLAYDMASFYDIPFEEAFGKIQAGLTGIVRPLKRLGILIHESIIKQYALNNAIGDGTGKLTELEKVEARYGALLQQTSKAQGDWQRTMNRGVNVFRSLWSQIRLTGIAIGSRLLPTVTKIVLAMRSWFEKNRELIAQKIGYWFDTLVTKLKPLVIGIGDLVTVNKTLIGQKLDEYFGKVGSVLETIGSTLKTIVKHWKGIAVAIGAVFGTVIVRGILVPFLKSLKGITKWIAALAANIVIAGKEVVGVFKDVGFAALTLKTKFGYLWITLKGTVAATKVWAAVTFGAITTAIYLVGKLLSAWLKLWRLKREEARLAKPGVDKETKAYKETRERVKKLREERKKVEADARKEIEERRRLEAMSAKEEADRAKDATDTQKERDAADLAEAKRVAIEKLEIERNYYESMEGFEKQLHNVRLKLIKLQAKEIAKTLGISEAAARKGLAARYAEERRAAAPMEVAAERARAGLVGFETAWSQIATGTAQIEREQLKTQKEMAERLRRLVDIAEETETFDWRRAYGFTA